MTMIDAPRRAPRHLLTLAADFRLAKDAQAAVLAALRRRPEQPRVLVIPQWCVDPPDRASAAFLSSSEVPSRSLRDLRESERAGTAGLCHKRGGGLPGKKSWFGASTVEEVVGDGDNGEMGGGLRGAGARRRSAREDVKISQGVSLLMSDLVGPVIVVDLWSAPALFLRHMEVSLLCVLTRVNGGACAGRRQALLLERPVPLGCFVRGVYGSRSAVWAGLLLAGCVVSHRILGRRKPCAQPLSEITM